MTIVCNKSRGRRGGREWQPKQAMTVGNKKGATVSGGEKVELAIEPRKGKDDR